MRRLFLLAVFTASVPFAAASAQGYPGMSPRGGTVYGSQVQPGYAYSGNEYPRQEPYGYSPVPRYDYGQVQQERYDGYGRPSDFQPRECPLPYGRPGFGHPGGTRAYEEDSGMARSAQARAVVTGGCQEWTNHRSGNRGVAWASGPRFRDRSGRMCQPVTEIVDVNGVVRRNEGGICR